MNSLFIQGKPFWNLLKYKRKRNFAMNEDLHGFTKHFQSIMTENGDLSPEQQMISDEVKGRYAKLSHDLIPHNIDVNLMRTYINKLRKKCAPGYDKVTAEHLQYAASDTFCTALASVYRTIYEYNLVPDVIRVGVIIPILKKPTLDVTAFNNYRPITLCSVYAKLLETMMIPTSDISVNQYGYQQGKGADFCCAMLNDIISVFNSGDSPVYICSLDAEKCFDSIWHDGLMFKLINHMPSIHWRVLCHWYQSLCAVVRINGTYGIHFQISKGTRQGSILSPYIFNIFINGLLEELEHSPCGLRIGGSKFNSMAYADDIELIAANVSDLQCLVNVCYNYSIKWRFKFGVKKSSFYVAGNKNAVYDSEVMLGHTRLNLVEQINVLGKIFESNGQSAEHVNSRIQKCRQALHAIGYRNEELCPAVKAHIWKTIGAPSLLYSMCTGPLSNSELKRLESFQGQMVKSSLYLGKRSHHSNLLKAVNISKISDVIKQQRISLLQRVFKAPVSSYSILCTELMSRYAIGGVILHKTLVGHIIEQGISPIGVAFSNKKYVLPNHTVENGVVDSIKLTLTQHVKPGNYAHNMLYNLTKSF